MANDKYGAKGWAKLWSKLEQQGNVGLDYCINPVLYPALCKTLGTTADATVVDFGAGTNIYAIQFMFGYAEYVPALNCCHRLERARANVNSFTGIEQSDSLVKEAQRYLDDLGHPRTVRIRQMDLVKGNKLPLKTASIDVATSRNFLMHLSVPDLEYHLAEVHRTLKRGGTCLFALLNPEYEWRKHKEATGTALENGQRYAFAHGAGGENGTFYHHFKTIEQYETAFRRHFKIRSKLSCPPITNAFKKSHPRYYWPDCPMAFLYELKNYDK